MSNARDNQAPVSEFKVSTDGTAENGMPSPEQEEYCDRFTDTSESKPVSEQHEFDFDAPLGDDYVSASPATEADQGVEDASVIDAEDTEAGETCYSSLADGNIDAPLYGAEEDNAEGWREIDFSGIDLDTLSDTLENGTASGSGGSTPPPHDPNTTSGGEENEPERSPEQSRSDVEFLPVAQNGPSSERSERSEQSSSFSSMDWDDSNWISPIYPRSVWEDLKKRGRPFVEKTAKDGTKRISKFNECYCASFVVFVACLHHHHGSWYRYHGVTGTWRALSDVGLRNVVYDVFIQLGEQFQIPQIEEYLSRRFCDDVIAFMEPFDGYEDIFDRAPWRVINVQNGTIAIGRDGSIEFFDHSPEFLSRSMVAINYDETADFRGFVSEAFGSYVSPEDVSVLQRYAGQSVLKRNISQKFLIISGDAGTGKSTIQQVIERVIGPASCEGLRTGMLERRFELSRFDGKSLLYASDECSDALLRKGAHVLKSLTGGDTLTTEVKCKNEHPVIHGNFSVIIVSNPDLALSIDDDRDAWRRRMLIVKYTGKPPKTLISDFAGYLLAKYSSAILNWMVAGAAAVLECGGHIDPHPEMTQRIDEIIQESDAAYAFVKNRVVRTDNPGDELLSRMLLEAFVRSKNFVGSINIHALQMKLTKAMKDVYKAEKRHDVKGVDGKPKYGYVGFRLIQDVPE